MSRWKTRWKKSGAQNSSNHHTGSENALPPAKAQVRRSVNTLRQLTGRPFSVSAGRPGSAASSGALPRVNSLVDVYNNVSLVHGLCLGADDLDKTFGDLAFRFSKADDSFVDMGAELGEDPNDPPKDGEVVYADVRHVL